MTDAPQRITRFILLIMVALAPSDDDVQQFLDRVTPAKRARDAQTLLELYSRATGLPARMWGTIVGFGEYDYQYDSGHSGTTIAAGFAPRKAATSIYLGDGTAAHTERLARLGPHRAAVGCLYLTDLSKNDLAVLEEIISVSFATLTHGTYTLRARDGRIATADTDPQS